MDMYNIGEFNTPSDPEYKRLSRLVREYKKENNIV